MLEIFKTIDGKLERLDDIEPGCWVNVSEPSRDEARWLVEILKVSDDFIEAMQDDQEVSRIDKDEDCGQALVVLDYPAPEDVADKANPDTEQFDTHPLSILLLKDLDVIVTSTLAPCVAIKRLVSDRASEIDTTKHVCLLLNILLAVSQTYIGALRTLEKETLRLERKMRKKQKSADLISMLGVENSLLYMSTSLKSFEPTLKSIKGGRFIPLRDEDQELFEDVMVEYQQATEMCTMYTDMISKAMDAFSGVMGNNVNVSMGILTTITLILSIPTVVFSFYGMNTDLLPLSHTWVYPMLLSGVLAAIAVVILVRFRR